MRLIEAVDERWRLAAGGKEEFPPVSLSSPLSRDSRSSSKRLFLERHILADHQEGRELAVAEAAAAAGMEEDAFIADMSTTKLLEAAVFAAGLEEDVENVE